MQNNPYDDFLKNIAKMVEEIIKDMPDGEHPRFIGCTIIAGSPSDIPAFFAMRGPQTPEGIRCELIESGDRIFITAQVPAEIRSAPYADINPDKVRISMGEEETTVPLPCPVDVIHSYYMVRHGVMDIILKKKDLAP
jgi:hypothetical protein